MNRPLPLLPVLLLAATAACTHRAPVPDTAHLAASDVPRAVGGTIPAPAVRNLQLPPPQSREAPQTFSIVVNEIPVQQLLFSMARDAQLNIDIHPDITGVVTLNVNRQTMPEILERIARQVDMRYELRDGNLTILPDAPYLQIYRIDYINIQRDTRSQTAIATQVSSTGAGAGGGASNNSDTTLVDTTKNRYWDTLVTALTDLLRETDKLIPDGAPAGSDTGGNSGGKDGAKTSPNVRFREAASVIAQPEAGIVAVRASARQHARIREFLDASVASAQRQVLIEATVVEVELSDGYQQGIDWQAVNTGSNRSASLKVQRGTTIAGRQLPAVGVLELARQTADWDIDVALHMLESFGQTRVLSSPKIAALNNQMALIKVVDNIVYFTLTTDYTPATDASPAMFTVKSTPTTVPVGFLMNVTPQIGDDGAVTLNLRPTISRLTGYVDDPGVALSVALARSAGTILPDIASRIPEIQTREMESVIRIQDGQIAVLGGLMRGETGQGEDGVPGLARVPLLGNLFRNNSSRNAKSELVIFLRPTIVHNASLAGDLRSLRDKLPDDAFFRAEPHPPYEHTLQETRP